MKNGMLLLATTEAPLPANPEPRGQCGTGQVVMMFFIFILALVINFILTITNMIWKLSALRILNMLLSIPFALVAMYMFSEDVGLALLLCAIVAIQFYMIKKSLPA